MDLSGKQPFLLELCRVVTHLWTSTTLIYPGLPTAMWKSSTNQGDLSLNASLMTFKEVLC